jgi:hypothetical protein
MDENRFKNRINKMNIGQKGNIERDIKAAANVAKTARNTKRANAIQRTKNEAAKAAKEAAELRAKGNIAKARIEAAKEAAAEAQRKRNEKRKQKFDNLLTQFNKDINSSQKNAFRQRFNKAQEARKTPNASRTNNQKGIIIRGGLAQIASELRKIKANKNEAAHKAAITRAKAAGSAAEVAKQKTAYLQKRQASFNKMVQNAKNRHPEGTNQRTRMETLITNLTIKFKNGQNQRTINGQQNQSIINAGKIPELAKEIRKLEREFNQNQRNKNAQNIKNAQAKAKKAETNRNQAQLESKKYKEQSQKYKNKTNSLLQQRRTLVGQRNAAKQELEKAKQNLANASNQSEAAQKEAKAKLEAAKAAEKAAQNELAKSKNASKLANKKRELTNLAREQRVLQILAPNGLTPNGFGPRRPFSRVINGLTVNDLANGGLAGKLPNQIQAAGTAKKANQNAKKKAEMEAAEKRRLEKQETKRKQKEAAAAKAKANQEKREKQKGSVIESIKKAQNASKAKVRLRERLNDMKKVITEKRAKENRIKKECASNPYLEQCGEGAIAARKKAAEKKAYKQKLTKLLNSYNNRLGSLVDAKGNPSWPGKKNELFKKYANTITNDKVIKAELNSMTKIHAEKTSQRKKEITKLLNSYNNRLGSKKWPERKGALLNKYMKSTKNLEQDKASLEALLKLKVQGKASKKAAKNLAAKKAANNLAAKKAANNLAAKQTAAATKIQAKVRGRLIKVKFAEYKPLKTKLESNSKLPRNEKQRLMNMLVRSYTNQDRDKFREVRKMIENRNKRVVSNLVTGAIKKAANSELINARIAYRQKVAMADRAGLFPTRQEVNHWMKPGENISFDARTVNGVQGALRKLQGHDKMLNTRLNELKREKNAKNKKPVYSASNSPPIRGDPRKGANPSGNGVRTNPLALEKKTIVTNPTFAANTWNHKAYKERLKEHISSKNELAAKNIPKFNGQRVSNPGYRERWIQRVKEEGDTATRRQALRKMFNAKFELKKKLLTNESSNVRGEYKTFPHPHSLKSLKMQVMRPFYRQTQSTKGTNQNAAIEHATRIEKHIEEARNRYNKSKKAPVGATNNKAINSSNVKITLKKAKPSLKNITEKKVIRPARMASQMKPKPTQGPSAMKLSVQAAAAKKNLGKPMTNTERRVAARKAAGATGRLGARINAAAVRKSAEGAAEAAKLALRKKSAVNYVKTTLKGRSWKNERRFIKDIEAARTNTNIRKVLKEANAKAKKIQKI